MQLQLNAVKWGLILSILTIFLGFALGAVMGGAESQVKEYWQNSANQVVATVYNNDVQKATAAVARSWVFMIRAHIHAAALGAASIAMIFLLSWLNAADNIKKIISLFLGLGSLGYSFSWLYTAFAFPMVGSVPATKAQIHIVAAGSIGMLLVATAALAVLCVKEVYAAQEK